MVPLEPDSVVSQAQVPNSYLLAIKNLADMALLAQETIKPDCQMLRLLLSEVFSSLCVRPSDSYGDRAQDITRIAEQRKLGKRLVRGYPVSIK